MANPYPADFLNDDGSVRFSGEVDFTDSQNQPGGGSQPGVATTIKLPFAYNTAGLAAGLTIYTPAIGDLLLAAWIEVDTAWDGTTPLGDFGTDFANAEGLYYGLRSPIDMTQADGAYYGGNTLLAASGGSYSPTGNFALGQASAVPSGSDDNAIWGRLIPAKFTAVTPLLVVVNQTGVPGGASPGAAQGAAVAYVTVVTPKAA